MGPKKPIPQTGDLFRHPLVEMINLKHPLVKLADVMDWELIENAFGAPGFDSWRRKHLIYMQSA